MNLNEIELLKIEDCINILRDRLNLEEDQEAIYSDYEEEFAIYKIELIEAETSRIEELNRQNDLKERWGIIKSRDAGVPAFYNVVKDVPNPSAYFRDNIPNKDKAKEIEELMVSIEAEDALITEELDANKYKELRRAEYGSLEDQADEQFHDYDAWKARIQSIKDKYPKS